MNAERKSGKQSARRMVRLFLFAILACLFFFCFSSCARISRTDDAVPSGHAGASETVSPYEEKAVRKMREKGIPDESAEEMYRILLALGMENELQYIVPVSGPGGEENCFRFWWENGDCTVKIGEGGELLLLDFDTEPSVPSRNLPVETEEPDPGTEPEETDFPQTTDLKETSSPETIGLPEETTHEPAVSESVEESTVSPETEPPETSAERQPPETAAGQTIQLLSFSETVSPGETAVLRIIGKPQTAYTIRVRYSSGYSSAAGLEEKTSGSDGVVAWSWKVGASTKAGTYPVTLTGGGEALVLSLIVKSGEASTQPPETTSETKEKEADPPERILPGEGVVVNTNTKKFHRPDCRHALSISDKKRLLLASREEAEALGYIPCKVCCP